MGVEVADISVDKETYCVTLYSNDNHNEAESYEHVEENPDSPLSDHFPKKFDVKECTVENSVEISEVSQDGVSKEEDKIVKSNVEVDLPQVEKVKSSPKDHSKKQLHVKHASKHPSRNVRINHTVPQPFALATEKRANGTRPTAAEPGAGTGVKKSSKTNAALQPNATKQNQQAPLISRKPLQPKNKKHPDEDDSCSVTSSITASGRMNKARSTAASAPTFRSTQRAEKRREFYTKLEEKQQALEAEKNQNEARSKEEREAALKQLRKSLTFKASPMPNFYHEGPPPKVELKKMPPTRAKSPKLGRRKSCCESVTSNQGENNTQHGNRNSVDYQKEDTTNPCICKNDDEPKHMKDTNKPIVVNGNAEICV
ncbi:hypothetical protein ACFE04_006040 [Oxalis oulophora]